MAESIVINATIGQHDGASQQALPAQSDIQTSHITIKLSKAGDQAGNLTTGTVSKDQANKLVDQANKIMSPTNVHYVYYDKLNRYYVQIEDSVTHKVIEEIPPKKLLDFAAAIAEKLGLIVNKRV